MSECCRYVLDGGVKDITIKYSSTWATSLRRLRLDDQWWNEVLTPYKPPSSCARNVSEDRVINGNSLNVALCVSLTLSGILDVGRHLDLGPL